jgi:hypothetical protein
MVTLNEFRFHQVPEDLKPLAASIQRQADISFAAAELARLPRRSKVQRIYTGRVFGKRRGWRGMKVLLPNGVVGQLYRSVRQLAAVTWRDELALRPDQLGVLHTRELLPAKHAAAVVLGGAKRGTRECSSEKKVEAARKNGRCPVRLGSRPRGRPKSPANGSILSP